MAQAEAARNVNLKEVIAENLLRLMEEKQVSRKQVCRDLDIKYTTFCDWVNAKTAPRIESLEILCGYFSVDVTAFFLEPDSEVTNRRVKRMETYAKKISGMQKKEVEYSFFQGMTDDQVREMMRLGYTLKHHTLEEIVAEKGQKEFVPSQFDWGEPVGDELW